MEAKFTKKEIQEEAMLEIKEWASLRRNTKLTSRDYAWYGFVCIVVSRLEEKKLNEVKSLWRYGD